MTVQRRNAELVSLLSADFVRRNEMLSGARKWKAAGVVGTAVVVVPDGGGDVVYTLTGLYAVRGDGGVTGGGTVTDLTPGNETNLYDDGGTNTLVLRVNADGSVDVRRTAGAQTWDVALWLLWL